MPLRAACVNDEGKEAYRLTAEGKQVAQRMALSSEDALPGIRGPTGRAGTVDVAGLRLVRGRDGVYVGVVGPDTPGHPRKP
jgi:hypothetical protein